LNKELPKEFFGLNVSLAYSDTNANKEAWTIGDKYLGDKAWVLSVNKTF